MHKSWGASLFSLEHSFTQIVIFFYPFGSSDLLIACFTLCYANEINLCHELCAMYLAIMTRLKLYNSGFTCGYHVLINYNLCFVYTGFFVDTYHDYYWPLRKKYMKKFISSYRIAFYRFRARLIVHHLNMCIFSVTFCDMHTSRTNSYYIGLLDVLSSILAFGANGEEV